MKLKRSQGITLVALAAVLLVGGGAFAVTIADSSGSSDSAASPNVSAPIGAARTAFPGLAAPTGEPQLDSIRSTRPRPGEIAQAAGPFDDRFVFEALAFDGAAVSGGVRVTSDVSELLDLEVVAGFYDDTGTLLGTGRFVHHVGEGSHSETPEELMPFTIAVPAEFAGRAASVALGVPVLVNE